MRLSPEKGLEEFDDSGTPIGVKRKSIKFCILRNAPIYSFLSLFNRERVDNSTGLIDADIIPIIDCTIFVEFLYNPNWYSEKILPTIKVSTQKIVQFASASHKDQKL